MEALEAYRVIFQPIPRDSWGGNDFFRRTNLEYALLLNQAGQWGEANAHYEAALPDLFQNDNEPKVAMHFDPNTPYSTALAAPINLALGYTDSFTPGALTEFEDAKAFQEYSAALVLEPNWNLTNYYYGFGWHRLNPMAPAKSDGVMQAKAALLKASRIAKGKSKKGVAKPF